MPANMVIKFPFLNEKLKKSLLLNHKEASATLAKKR